MDQSVKVSLPVLGMSCAACAGSVQSLLRAQNGVQSADVNYGNKTVRLEYSPAIVSLPDIRDQVRKIGYDLMLDEEDRQDKLESMERNRFKKLRLKLGFAVLFSLPVFILSMWFHHSFNGLNYLLFALSLPVILFPGAEFYPPAYRQLRHGLFTMDSLVAAGTGIAFLFSTFNTFFPSVLISYGLHPVVYFESAAVIITFILLGRFLEERAKKSASSAIRKLYALQSGKVSIERAGEQYELSPLMVVPGDRVTIKAGDRIQVDGIISEGSSAVDESSITGEFIPVQKSAGDQVYAGTISTSGILVIEASRPGNDTVLARIIRLVDEAQSTKPPVQKLVDRVAQIFVPVVFGIALITFIAWIIAGSFGHAMVTMISVLIIACPCALGLATPAALITGVGRGAREGILIRNATALEIAHTIDTLLMDKTGTLTKGKPGIGSLKWKADPDDETIRVWYAMESGSRHPLARAICQRLRSDFPGLEHTKLEFDSYTEIAGKGIQASFGGHDWYAGNQALMNDGKISETGEPGLGNVFFARDTILLAELTVTDELRPDAKSLINQLKLINIEPFMLTGDRKETAEQVAHAAGIEKVFAQVLPDEKGKLVKELQENGRKVAMIGDGINDAYALAAADLGIAMGEGTDIAMESAGIVLMHSDLKHVIKAIQLAKSTRKIIRQNLFWAFVYNLMAIPLAAGLFYTFTGRLLDPMIAGAAMAMSSVSVVLNSLRLKTMKL